MLINRSFYLLFLLHFLLSLPYIIFSLILLSLSFLLPFSPLCHPLITSLYIFLGFSTSTPFLPFNCFKLLAHSIWQWDISRLHGANLWHHKMSLLVESSCSLMAELLLFFNMWFSFASGQRVGGEPTCSPPPNSHTEQGIGAWAVWAGLRHLHGKVGGASNGRLVAHRGSEQWVSVLVNSRIGIKNYLRLGSL